jgi:hypothetical protein
MTAAEQSGYALMAAGVIWILVAVIARKMQRPRRAGDAGQATQEPVAPGRSPPQRIDNLR